MASKLIKKGKEPKSVELIPIERFLDKIGKTREQLYQLVRDKEWWNGFVLRRPSHKRIWESACMEEYNEWVNS